MNISFQSMSLIIGSVVGVLAIFAIKNPLLSLVSAVIAAVLTEGVLRLQNNND